MDSFLSNPSNHDPDYTLVHTVDKSDHDESSSAAEGGASVSGGLGVGVGVGGSRLPPLTKPSDQSSVGVQSLTVSRNV